jgi:hypothetical protein
MQEAPHVDKNSIPVSIFLFLEVIQLLMVETNKYYLDTLDSNGAS